MKSVQVLLSTYNGEQYIKEQLDSILNQDYSNITILIRDDGSKDKTVSILDEYASEYNNITYYQGQNIGVINSFFDLMKNADMSADYYSLSDQDDVWDQKKISCAVAKLESMNQKKSSLYCGRTTLVNQDLERINSTIKEHKIVPDFGNALVENICTGCTCVMNHKLLQIIQTHIPRFTVMHDWWIYLIASSVGEVCYDNNSYMLYRQHDKNVVGTSTNYIDEFKVRLRNYRKNSGQISKQAREFQRLLENESNKQLLETIIGSHNHLSYKIKILLTNKIYRQRKLDNIIFKILFLIGHV